MDFNPTEEPQWRPEKYQSTSNMLKEIHHLQQWFKNAPLSSRDKIIKIFNKRSAVEWVLNSNHLELEGTLDGKDTAELCQRYFSKKMDNLPKLDKKEIVTINTLKALTHVHKCRVEMKEYVNILPEEQRSNNDSLYLTEHVVKEIHEIVLPRDKKYSAPPGVYRRAHAFPYGSSDRFYCPPHEIEMRMERLMDLYNDYVEKLPKNRLHNDMEFDERDARKVYNLAAWILFHFVNIHPFSDGNGRMCRLLANSVLFNECPFPVFLKGPYPLKVARKIYLSSIIHCRDSYTQVPAMLSAFIIESCLEQWKSFKVMYDQWITEKILYFRSTSTLETIQKEYLNFYYTQLAKEETEEILIQLKAKKHGDRDIVYPFTVKDDIKFKGDVRQKGPILIGTKS